MHTQPRPCLMLLMAAAVALAACSDQTTAPPDMRLERDQSFGVVDKQAGPGRVTIVHYDSKSEAEYGQKWTHPYGLLELEAGGTRTVSPSGAVTVTAVPFRVGADFSVFDHLKYIAVSTRDFKVPEVGSVTFAVDIRASTPGTQPGRIIHGCYGEGGSYTSLDDACAQPWQAAAFEGQQAAVVLNMIDFSTGQLFDWFVSGNEVFALIERLPSLVTNPSLPESDPAYVGLDKAYTQIIKRQAVPAGHKHRVAIRYTRGPGISRVEYFLNEELFASVDNVGIPLDKQGVPYTGVSPSYGPGEVLQLDSFVMAHGLFSLLDAFPYQHPERPDLSVSIPISERLFGQGAQGTFTNFRVIIEKGLPHGPPPT